MQLSNEEKLKNINDRDVLKYIKSLLKKESLYVEVGLRGEWQKISGIVVKKKEIHFITETSEKSIFFLNNLKHRVSHIRKQYKQPLTLSLLGF